ncbi:N-6 DNA methylase [Corynebacterium phocae]|uniref:N-6 DNA methylase n=1 Tax=Corynebacterium phocae TaxID=161895 RepID=A0A1L7D4U9_9CORY|nr:DNA N-6-adenine-methyltransferase [Corynebacterium phocae]APT93174.1 N-6 DNA methylase [Corynebacterium phocae]KAA8722254.1 N-6 DNA methylase [Corynebacterium phocae]
MTAGRQSVSTTKDWNTPPWIVEAARATFGGTIGLDPCSNRWSLVGAREEYILPDKDGLVEDWDAQTIYVNPPYGSDRERGTRIIHWFEKIAVAADRGSEIIALVPVATNTNHWKWYVYPKAAAVCFLYQSRVRFYIDGKEDPKGAPMSCAVIYYGDNPGKFARHFREFGAVLPLDNIAMPQPKGALF